MKNSLLNKSVRDEMAERGTGDNELQAGHRPGGVGAKMVERNPAKATSSARWPSFTAKTTFAHLGVVVADDTIYRLSGLGRQAGMSRLARRRDRRGNRRHQPPHPLPRDRRRGQRTEQEDQRGGVRRHRGRGTGPAQAGRRNPGPPGPGPVNQVQRARPAHRAQPPVRQLRARSRVARPGGRSAPRCPAPGQALYRAARSMCRRHLVALPRGVNARAQQATIPRPFDLR